jgi:hypothetical protein
VLPVRYRLSYYRIFKRKSVFKALSTAEQLADGTSGAGMHRPLFHCRCHDIVPNVQDCDRTKVDFSPLEPDLYARVSNFTLDWRSCQDGSL